MVVAFVCVSQLIGCTRGLLRVAQELRKSGEKVSFLTQAGSPAEQVLGEEADEPFQRVVSISDFITLVGSLQSQAVLMSWCAEVGRAAVPVLKERGISTVLVEDTWWHGGVLDQLSEAERPRLVCVGTEHCRRRVLAAWHGYPAEQVQVTGWPAFDRYAGLDVPAIADEVRQELGLHEDWLVIFLGIDDLPGSGQMVADFVECLNEIGQPVYFVPGFHPAFDRRVPEERPAVERALAQFESGVLVDRGTVETTRLVAMADIVVAMFSTILAEAACLRKQAIAVLYPDTGQRYMQAEMGIEEFPLVSLGCAVKASNDLELAILLDQALGGGLGFEEAQRQTFRLDGQNARRVAELII